MNLSAAKNVQLYQSGNFSNLACFADLCRPQNMKQSAICWNQSKQGHKNLDPPSVEFAGDSRRWARRRTLVLQTPTNKEDPAKSADPKGQKEEGNTAVAHASAR